MTVASENDRIRGFDIPSPFAHPYTVSFSMMTILLDFRFLVYNIQFFHPCYP